MFLQDKSLREEMWLNTSVKRCKYFNFCLLIFKVLQVFPVKIPGYLTGETCIIHDFSIVEKLHFPLRMYIPASHTPLVQCMFVSVGNEVALWGPVLRSTALCHVLFLSHVTVGAREQRENSIWGRKGIKSRCLFNVLP